jgi:BirA family biotin operon repressor/biotin-[acetyl-CoA-carboxylase] ligase
MSVGGATRFREVRRYREVDSTNRVVADLAREGAAEGIVVVADHQTAGRGRWGRRWESPPGSSLLVSVLLRPRFETSLAPLVTLAAGVAGSEACEAVAGVATALKWPNDLLAAEGEGKLGGILTELVAGPPLPAVVVGLGLNLRWDAALPDGATALNQLTATPVERDALLASFLSGLDRHTAGLGDPAGRRRLLDRYRELSCTLGRTVTVSRRGPELVGRATGVGPDGRLVVEATDGSRHEVSDGDVTHLRA